MRFCLSPSALLTTALLSSGVAVSGCDVDASSAASHLRWESVAPNVARSTPKALGAVATAKAAEPEPVLAESLGCQRVMANPKRYLPKLDLPLGYLVVPRSWQQPPPRPPQVLVHFHGHDAALADFQRAGTDIGILGIESQPGTYDDIFSGAVVRSGLSHARVALAQTLDTELESDVWKSKGALVIGAWSNGFGAIGRLLSEPDHGITAVIVLDGMHSTDVEKDRAFQLRHLIEYAKLAAQGQVFFFLSHSEVETSGYASTTDSAKSMLEAMYPDGRPPDDAFSIPPPPLPTGRPNHHFHQRGMTVLGYPGDDRDAHCNQMGLYPYAIALYRQWLNETSDLR